ncbi:hypothetical protein [Sorangium sp. So ce1099]|uniref:hypothetical protein n=1 Tax=Sorangium sp. So ce1099 TaxID=3133331 RepID=UPI003F62EB89
MANALGADSLIRNPSFEANAAGWAAWQGHLATVERPDAPEGARVGRVTFGGAGDAYSIDDAPDTVPWATAGTTYRACASVAAASSSAVGKPIHITLRERTPAGEWFAAASAPSVALTRSFQRICVDASVARSFDPIDAYVLQEDAAPGDAFDVDAFEVTTSATLRARAGFANGFIQRYWAGDTLAARLDTMAGSGARWLRVEVHGYDATYPGLNWGGLDGLLDGWGARGGEAVVLIIHHRDRDEQGRQDLDPDHYRAFATAVVEKVAGRARVYEIENEPVLDSYGGASLAEKARLYAENALVPASLAIKAADPTAVVLAGSGSLWPLEDAQLWMETLYTYAAGAFDGVAAHPYTWPSPPTPDNGIFQNLDAVAAILAAHGDAHKPIVITEWGAPTGGTAPVPGFVHVSEEEHARQMRVFWDTWVQKPYGGPAFVYSLIDDPDQAASTEGHFGLLRADGSEKPSMAAWTGRIGQAR